MSAATARLSLHDIGDAQDILDAFLLETEGEETPEISALWDALQGQRDEKIERWGLWLRGQQLQAELIKAEEERLAARRKAIEHAIARGKAALQMNMERLNVTKVDGKLLTVAVQANPASVQGELTEEQLRTLMVVDAALVKRVPESYSLVKAEVLKAHKAGRMIPAGLTITQSTSLRIR
jgi:hypothetical protein